MKSGSDVLHGIGRGHGTIVDGEHREVRALASGAQITRPPRPEGHGIVPAGTKDAGNAASDGSGARSTGWSKAPRFADVMAEGIAHADAHAHVHVGAVESTDVLPAEVASPTVHAEIAESGAAPKSDAANLGALSPHSIDDGHTVAGVDLVKTPALHAANAGPEHGAVAASVNTSMGAGDDCEPYLGFEVEGGLVSSGDGITALMEQGGGSLPLAPPRTPPRSGGQSPPALVVSEYHEEYSRRGTILEGGRSVEPLGSSVVATLGVATTVSWQPQTEISVFPHVTSRGLASIEQIAVLPRPVAPAPRFAPIGPKMPITSGEESASRAYGSPGQIVVERQASQPAAESTVLLGHAEGVRAGNIRGVTTLVADRIHRSELNRRAEIPVAEAVRELGIGPRQVRRAEHSSPAAVAATTIEVADTRPVNHAHEDGVDQHSAVAPTVAPPASHRSHESSSRMPIAAPLPILGATDARPSTPEGPRVSGVRRNAAPGSEFGQEALAKKSVAPTNFAPPMASARRSAPIEAFFSEAQSTAPTAPPPKGAEVTPSLAMPESREVSGSTPEPRATPPSKASTRRQDQVSPVQFRPEGREVVAPLAARVVVAPPAARVVVGPPMAREVVASAVAREAVASLVAREVVAPPAARAGVASHAAREVVASFAARAGVASHAAREVVASHTAREVVASHAAREVVASPAAREAVAPSVAREVVAPHAAREAVASPAAREVVAPHAAREVVAPHAAREAVASPAVREVVAPPVAHEVVAPPATREVVAPHVAHEVVAPPATREVVAPPATREVVARQKAPDPDRRRFAVPNNSSQALFVPGAIRSDDPRSVIPQAHPTPGVSPVASRPPASHAPEGLSGSESPLRPESRRVRAAVLDLQERSFTAGKVAGLPSSARSSFDTAALGDKKKSGEKARPPFVTGSDHASPPGHDVDLALVHRGPNAPVRTSDDNGHRDRDRPDPAFRAEASTEPTGTSSASPAAAANEQSPSDQKRESQMSSRVASSDATRTSALPTQRPALEPQVGGAAAVPGPPSLSPSTPDLRALGLAVVDPLGREARALLDLAADDPSLHASALGKNAHVRLETTKDGDLSLHLTVRDGTVDVRLDGAASRTLDIRPNEVRVALAGEGISLGSFESSGSSSSAAPQVNQSGSDPAGSGGRSSQPGQPEGAPMSSHSGSNLGGGGGGRHAEPGDRWPDRTPLGESHGAASVQPSINSRDPRDPRRRRGFHVTA